MLRTKGEPGTGDIVQAVRHMRKMNSEIQKLTSMREDELFEAAKVLQVPYDLVQYVHDNGRLPVVNFAAGGVATPADAALMMQYLQIRQPGKTCGFHRKSRYQLHRCETDRRTLR